MRKGLSAFGIVAAGVVMVLGGFAHGFLGWPAMSEALAPYPVDPNVVAALGVGWWFGSVAMLALGAIVLAGFPALRRGERFARQATFVPGLAYLLFGIGAFVYRDFNPHFLFFILVGLLLCLSVLAYPRRP